MGGLNLIVKSSRLRFKSVCKFWRSLLIQSTDLYTNTNTNFNSSSSKFGTFLFHVSGPRPRGCLQESTILMLSPGSESEFEESRLSVSSSPRSGSGGGWCWSTDTDGLCDKSITWSPACKSAAWNTYFAHKESNSSKYYDDYAEEKVFKIFSNKHQHQHEHEHEHEMVFKLDDLGIPSCYKFFEYPTKYIVGSCNGLICLFDRENMDVSLWNPATRQFRILPKWLTIQTVSTEERHYLVSFGFDVETKDYKVVVVIWSSPRPSEPPIRWLFTSCSCGVQVYSLSSNSWRVLKGIRSLPGIPINQHYQALYRSGIYHSVYLNGSCFFIASFYHDQPMFGRFIISFDFTKEIFTSMQFPDHDGKQELFLSFLGEKLAVFSVCHQSPIYYHMGLMVEDYDIWVLNKNEYNGSVNKESWTKLHSFQTITEGGECIVPIGISDDGEFALLELRGGRDGLSKKMQLYNLVNKETTKDFLYCGAVWSKAIPYEPSHVPLIGSVVK